MNFYKNIKMTLGILAIVSLVSSCDDGFDELNVNPNASPVILSDMLLAYTQNGIAAHRYEAWRSNLLHAATNANHMMTPWSTPYATNEGWNPAYWDRMYVREVSNIKECISIIDNNSELSDATKLGKKSIARIWKVFIFHRITDFWGDVPYSEAGLGHTADGTVTPAYDTQESIYADMLNELAEAVGDLSPGGNSFGANDILYGGDHDSWIAFGNSLRLRLGMRLTNANATLAQSNVEAAVAGSLISSNAGTARVPFYSASNDDQWSAESNGSSAPIQAFTGSFMTADFINVLVDNADPRLPVYALPTSGTVNNGNYMGVPNGAPATPITPAIGVDYSLPNNTTVFAIDADAVLLGYPEVLFLLAEAAERGWNVSGAGTAQELYEQGISASLQYHNVDDGGTYSAGANVVFNTGGSTEDRLDQIATQKWLALFGDEYESWADLRRAKGSAGLDWFTQVNGAIPERLDYPVTEQTLNGDQYTAAVARQGADNEATKIYWSK
ncbi:Starch-binding associating with outer membrane [Reichenbachiella faecimaris]|uniref:Starch-binding associating with outer membrane n=1 Tax=Reichenbachiella faecimaris TaxID=692418 RepID=A0A1W2G5Q3_REIFA|nr:SusD/RagB family nutrient-binding outer membrane lipoprotein [Reichenbachiella faecimaris]SMD31933.1 Starch-binding associating with outer membrane [Reichenbachiella faecimaris]